MIQNNQAQNPIISIIIPVYNSEEYLERCLDSIVNQTISPEQMEVILVDDGSTDASPDICLEYVAHYPFIKLITTKNSGVSRARNEGIQASSGRYLLFLDSDDYITEASLQNICAFFEEHEEDIDILTYPIYYDTDITSKCDHFRYRFLTEDGVYDTEEFPFICQTTMNICVKRVPDEPQKPILFHTDMAVHEDQDYICRHILHKNRIGFVTGAAYHYLQHDSSVAHTKLNPLYSFDTLSNFEGLMAQYPDSKYLKCLFLYDFNWRLLTDQLYPYHFSDTDFIAACERLAAILKTIDPLLVMIHPAIDYFHRYYILEKMELPVQIIHKDGELCLYQDSLLLHRIPHIEIVVSKIELKQGTLQINAFLKDVSFTFSEKPILYAVADGKRFEVTLYDSAAGYYRTKIKTNTFYGFYFAQSVLELSELYFEIEVNGYCYPASYYFMYLSSIDRLSERKGFTIDGIAVELSDDNHFLFDHISREEAQIFSAYMERDCPEKYRTIKELPAPKERVWIYYDCEGVMVDNGLLQFLHDVCIKDGVKRYFIWNNPMEDLPDLVPQDLHRNVVPFGSLRHKSLLFAAEKIITAYIENKNIYPFYASEYHWIADHITAEIIYLQHGILHASMPWKYTPDATRFDKIVVSSYFEIENFKTEYHVPEKSLIPAGMPRFEMLDRNATPENRILFAPSWRSYLIKTGERDRTLLAETFLASNYYRGIMSFLTDRRLLHLLEEHDMHLDFKLHPIFKAYQDLFDIENDRIHFADPTVQDEQYALFITDFSSFSFDFVWLKRRIIYFVPDYLEFTAGCNVYRTLDLPFSDAFGNLVRAVDDLLEEIIEAVADDCKPQPEYQERMDRFFLPIHDCTNAIYQALIKNHQDEKMPLVQIEPENVQAAGETAQAECANGPTIRRIRSGATLEEMCHPTTSPAEPFPKQDGYAIGNYMIEKFRCGELGLRTLAAALIAWLKYKLHR